MSQTKNLPDALFRITKHLFLAIWLAEWLAMFCWVRQTALPRWLPCFVWWGKQPSQDGCHVLLGEANSPVKMFYNRNNHLTLVFCWVRCHPRAEALGFCLTQQNTRVRWLFLNSTPPAQEITYWHSSNNRQAQNSRPFSETQGSLSTTTHIFTEQKAQIEVTEIGLVFSC